MKKEYATIELMCVSFVCAFISSLLLQCIHSLLLKSVLYALLCTFLVMLYALVLRPILENRLQGTECENTQADQYRCEAENEETGEEI